MPTVQPFATRDALIDAAAAHIITHAQAAIQQRGRFNLVLAGGSTPKPIYERLVTAAIDWSNVHFYWGDERTVPPNHPDSNYHMAYAALLQHIEPSCGGIHRMRGELSPEDAATQYEATLRTTLDDAPFDLVLLGMGNDGHTASLFPHTAALSVTDRACVANYVEKLATWRLTLTAPIINAARQVTFLITGDDKAAPLYEILHGAPNPQEYPAQTIQPISGGLTFIVDAAAASRL